MMRMETWIRDMIHGGYLLRHHYRVIHLNLGEAKLHFFIKKLNEQK